MRVDVGEVQDEDLDRSLFDFLNRQGSETLLEKDLGEASKIIMERYRPKDVREEIVHPLVVIECISQKILLSLKENAKFRNNKIFAVFLRLDDRVQLNLIKSVVNNCNKALFSNPEIKIRSTKIKKIQGASHLQQLDAHFISKGRNFYLTVGTDLNFGIFNYYFTKLFLGEFNFPHFNMKQWIYLMNFNNSYTNLFIDGDKKIDLINRVRLIFKEMYMRKSTNIVVFDGHGRTIFLLIQFMYAYNYEFNIKVYEILKGTYSWHVDFFPSEPNETGKRLINIEGDIQNLINGTYEDITLNLTDTLVYLNFCGIGGLHGLIFNFIKVYKEHFHNNHSLWISSIVTKDDASYLYKITPRRGNKGFIQNFEKIAILLYISFLSSGKLIGTSDNIPDEIIRTKLFDTLRRIKLNDPINHGDSQEINDTLLSKINNRENRENRESIESLVTMIHNPNTPDGMLNEKIQSTILDKQFIETLKRNAPEQRHILRRGGEHSLEPNRGYSFITFRIDKNRIQEFEENPNNETLILDLDKTWGSFFQQFRINFGFVPKYFFKYLKYKQKYLNLVKQLNNNLLK